MYFGLVFIYIISSMIKIKHFTSGVSKALSMDRKVIAVAILGVITYGISGIMNPSIGYVQISGIMMTTFWLLVSIEMIKRGALILLSENSRYWEYQIPGRETAFWMISQRKSEEKI
jgi:hypothetical protein